MIENLLQSVNSLAWRLQSAEFAKNRVEKNDWDAQRRQIKILTVGPLAYNIVQNTRNPSGNMRETCK